MVKERTIVIKDIFRRGDNKIKDFNGYHAIAYASSQLFYHVGLHKSMITISSMCQLANIKHPATKTKIKKALLELIEIGLIEVENIGGSDKIGNNDTLLISIPQIALSNDKFTTINSQFVTDIITHNSSITERGNMLTVYMVLAQYMGNNVIAYPNMETIAHDSNLSIKTVNNMLKLLKELKIIEYGNNNTYNGCLVGNIYIFCDTPNHSDIFQSEMSQLTSAEVNKERWLNIDCSVYVVRLYNEYENFYKIGISVDVPRRLNQIPYKHEIIDVTETNMYEAYYLENELHQKYKQYRYFPAKDFDGKTECFHYIY